MLREGRAGSQRDRDGFGSTRVAGDLGELAHPSPDERVDLAGAPIAELNTPSSDVDLWISEDRRRALFGSDRSGNNEIYEATR